METHCDVTRRLVCWGLRESEGIGTRRHRFAFFSFFSSIASSLLPDKAQGGAFTSFVPRIVPDNVPIVSHFIEVFQRFDCGFVIFLSNRERASTHPYPNPNHTPNPNPNPG